jgi:hypothetical protein
MKKTILVCVLITLCIDSFAQTDSIRSRTRYNDENKYDDKLNMDIDRQHQKNDNIYNNCVATMIDGKMMIMSDGKTVMMDKEMVLRNGTVVRMDGTVKMKDGETVSIQEGDCIDLSGRMVVMKTIQVKGNPKGSTK